MEKWLRKQLNFPFICCFSYVGVQVIANKRGLHLCCEDHTAEVSLHVISSWSTLCKTFSHSNNKYVTCLDGNLTLPHSYTILTHLYLGSHRDIIKNQLKEFRRTPSKREAKESLTQKRLPKKKVPGIIFSPLHPVPAQGEDCFLRET